jgi:hypothetical protein
MNDMAKELSPKIYSYVLNGDSKLKNLMSEEYRYSMFIVPKYIIYKNEAELYIKQQLEIIRARTGISPTEKQIEDIKQKADKPIPIVDGLTKLSNNKEAIDLWVNDKNEKFRLNYPTLSQCGLSISEYNNIIVCLMIVKTAEINVTDRRYWELIGLQ